jgi:F0F1-type ATP synthase gamma subunit
MKQTVVEWLIDQLEKKGDASVNMSIGRMQISIIEEDYVNLLEQAKEIEKQQQGYSKEEVLNFTQTIIQQYKLGNTNIEQLDLLKETLEQFKKK